jgi:hypothetical protein
MMTSLNSFAMVAVAGALTALAASPVLAASLDSSTADALSAGFTADGFLTTLPPVAEVHGSAPPPYNKQIGLPVYDKILNIAEKVAPLPELFVHLTGINDHVAGSGIGIDSFSSEGDTKIETAALSLIFNPLPPTAGPPADAPPAGSPDLLIAKAKTTMAKMAIALATLAAVIGRPLRCLAAPSMAPIRPIGLMSPRPLDVQSL